MSAFAASVIWVLASCDADEPIRAREAKGAPPAIDPPSSPTTASETFDWECSPTAVAEVVGMGTFADLDTAVDRMPEGGEVIVCPGTYPGAFRVFASGTIRSRNGAALTTLFGTRHEPTLAIDGARTLVLEGFTVTAGTGGVSLDGGAIAALLDCRITGNDRYGVFVRRGGAVTVDRTEISYTLGYGVFLDQATLVLSDSSVRGNATSSGAGISMNDGSTVSLVRSEVVDNAATWAGGGVYGSGSLLLDPASRIADNTARLGGNVYLLGPSTVTGGTYEGGAASEMGGGLALFGNHIELVDVVVRGNTAVYGGGLYYYGVQLAVTGGEFADNQASWGGGLAGAGSDAVVTGARITGNAAAVGGAASLDPGWGTFLAVEVDWGVLGLDANTPNEVTVDEVVYPVDGVTSFGCDLPAAEPCAF